MLKNNNGFALFEIVIAIAMFAVIGGIGMVSFPHIVHIKNHNKTEDFMGQVKDAYETYYEANGVKPASLDDIAPFIPASAPLRDSWGREISLFENAQYEATTGSVITYDAIIVSGGKNGVVDSAIDANTGYLVIGDTDLAIFVSLASAKQKKISVAQNNLSVLKDALIEAYNKTGALPTEGNTLLNYTSFFSVDGSGYPLDPWGARYVLTIGASAIYGTADISSNGPDRIAGGGDDLIVSLTPASLLKSARGETASKIDRANSSKIVYEQNWGQTTCSTQPSTCVAALVVDPDGGSLLPAVNTYDAWGTLLRYDSLSAGFISAGPDKDFATTTDNIN